MSPNLILLLFAFSIGACVAAGIPVAWALAAGLVLFLRYGRQKGFGWGELAAMCRSGFGKTKAILFVYVLIGCLTASWRAAGTIPEIVTLSSVFISPTGYLLTAFLLNCLLSVLTGTSFGTAATMGVITMSIGIAMGADPALLGGAILSGAYFGDRCSPVSTSALLVASLTGTGIYRNIRLMIWSGAAAFGLTCAAFFALSFLNPGEAGAFGEVFAVFERVVKLHWIAALPAALVLGLALARAKMPVTLGAGILSACAIALFYQGVPAADLVCWCLTGYRAPDAEAARLLDGGGIASMVNVSFIILISSCYSGIFEKTGLLDSLQGRITALAGRIGSFPALCLGGFLSPALACNQTLGIIITHQLFRKTVPDREELAIGLENSAVLLAALIPWCAAGAVPIAAIGAPMGSFPAAVYLWLLPLLGILASLRKKKRAARAAP